MPQGSHAARTLLHDIAAAPDPGPYAPTTGFTMSLYRQPIAALGVALPNAEQRHYIVRQRETACSPPSTTLTAVSSPPPSA